MSPAPHLLRLHRWSLALGAVLFATMPCLSYLAFLPMIPSLLLLAVAAATGVAAARGYGAPRRLPPDVTATVVLALAFWGFAIGLASSLGMFGPEARPVEDVALFGAAATTLLCAALFGFAPFPDSPVRSRAPMAVAGAGAVTLFLAGIWLTVPGALHQAARAGSATTVRAALALGAEVDHTDSLGRTALLLATGAPEATRVLIEAGADVNRADNGGTTPLYRASIGCVPATVALLLDAGATANPELFPDPICPEAQAVLRSRAAR